MSAMLEIGFRNLAIGAMALVFLWAGRVSAVPAESSVFKPKSFTASEFATLSSITEIIMPSGQFPGAREAHVSKFIDFQAVYDRDLRTRFREGLAWLDKTAQTEFGRSFKDLKITQKREILDRLHFKALFRPGEEKGQEFYRLVRRYTDMGFYSSTAGLSVLRAPVESGPTLERRERVVKSGSSLNR